MIDDSENGDDALQRACPMASCIRPLNFQGIAYDSQEYGPDAARARYLQHDSADGDGSAVQDTPSESALPDLPSGFGAGPCDDAHVSASVFQVRGMRRRVGWGSARALGGEAASVALQRALNHATTDS